MLRASIWHGTTSEHKSIMLIEAAAHQCVECCLQAKIVEEVRKAIALEKDSAGREEAMENVNREIKGWVAKYRRAGVTGRPSYG